MLSCVFVRFLEDNRLYETPLIAGPVGQTVNGNDANHRNHKSHDSHNSHRPGTPDNRLQRAKDERELFFRQHPGLTDRDYLLHVFHTYRDLKGGVVKEVFGGHNPVNELPNWLGPDAAGIVLRFFQQINPDTGDIRHDFTNSSRHSPSAVAGAAASVSADGTWNVPATLDTRFLGDLYQDLSEAARKKYALLQTLEFVEDFILDRTLDPALDEFGLRPSEPTALAAGSSSSARVPEASANGSFKMIDPACGSGHFLLGAFPRILDRWQRREPATNIRELVQRTLHSIHGVDVNPYAIAIARFRLLLAAMRECNVTRLMDAPAFRMNLVCGDSLLHVPLKSGGTKFTKGQLEFDAMVTDAGDEVDHAYQSEDLEMLKRLLKPGQYHAVVANPPYIVPKDRALNDQYRNRFDACHRKYSLAVPFMEQLFRLAVQSSRHSPSAVANTAASGSADGTRSVPATMAGYTGQITANSFMKREFGKKLIESFFPTVDLTHVIDTSGAYIPGHGTPTVILFGRNRMPVANTLRTVLGIRGEPATPDDPSQGLVWSAIVTQVDQPGSRSEFVSAGDSSRDGFQKHPWSIGGGGASELKEQLDEKAITNLDNVVAEIGYVCITKADELFAQPCQTFLRYLVEDQYVRPFGVGESVRDWNLSTEHSVIFPYDEAISTIEIDSVAFLSRFLWPWRTELGSRIVFGGQTYFASGKPWYEYGQIPVERAKVPRSIVFGEIATHNHFVLDRGGKVFRQTAPVIKLPREASEDDHLALLGLLNSSTACFWMKQVCHNKGSTVDQHGARQRTAPFEDFYAFNGTKLQQFPLPTGRPLAIAKYLDAIATQASGWQAASIVKLGTPTQRGLSLAESFGQIARQQLITAQEELDWECYHLYGLTETALTRLANPGSAIKKGQSLESAALGAIVGIELGQRAFEIVMARKIAAGELQTTWFDRHGSTPITELPAEWPDDYRQLVERRIELIENDPNIRLIEQPEYKRRWNTESWESQLERALRNWLLDRLESYFDFDGRMKDIHHGEHGEHGEDKKNSSTVKADRPSQCDSTSVNSVPSVVQNALTDIQLASIATLADVASKDADFMQVAELYRDDPAFSVQALVEELVAAESVPLLPVLRYKDTGLRKRAEWEKTWELQREEDRISNLKSEISNPKSPIPVPPKYTSADFLSTGGARYWALRASWMCRRNAGSVLLVARPKTAAR